MTNVYPITSVPLTACKDIAYIDTQRGGKTLLFVHGLAGYHGVWTRNIDELHGEFRCIALDLPGNGFSSYGENHDYSISFFVQCLKEFVDALQLQQVYLIGHSLGGQIAIKFTADYPHLVEQLVLCAPAGFETFTAFEKNMYQSTFHFFNFFSSDDNSLAKSITTSFYHYTGQADDLITHSLELLKRYPAGAFRKMIESCIQGMLDEPVFQLLKKIKQETLVIFGERDVFIPNRLLHPYNTRHIAEEGIAQLKNGTLELLPRSGHFVQWEKCKEVNSLIKEFIRS